MKPIGKAYIKCQSCRWKGRVEEHGEEDHDDGSLDCPQCHAPCEMDWEREKLELLQGLAYTLMQSTDIPPQFVQLVDDQFWEVS